MNLLELLKDLEKRAAAKLAEIKDDTAVDAARAIEGDHAKIVEEIVEVKRKIEAEKAEGNNGNRAADNVNAERAAKKAADDAVAAERKRVSEIRTLAKEGNEVELGDAAIAAGHSVDQFRSHLLEALMKREAPATDTVVGVGEEHHEKRAALLEAALKDRAGVNDVELNDGAREYRGMTLLDMAREALDLRGEKTRGLAREEIARRALMQRSGGYGSTSDFPIILGNVMRTTLRAAYDVAGQTFRPLVRQTTVPDFRSVSSAQLGGGMSFKKVNEHGEYKRSSLTESKEQYRVATYGTIIGVTRQVIINDDMNAFGRIPSLFGRDAANLESDLVWAQIIGNPTMGDSVALFHATHKNLPTAAAFSVASLGVAKALMSKQVDTDGTTVLNVRPKYLIVPVDLETKAEQELKLVTSLALSDSTKVATNSMRGLEIISEPRLDNGFTNPDTGVAISGSSTAWYLASAPSNIDVVELAYLADSGGAVHTETRYGFDVDGVEFKARLDVGAKTMDWRGLLKNAGA